MVWATSNRIGCAIHTCHNMNVWGSVWRRAVYLVCNYAPKWVTFFSYCLFLYCLHVWILSYAYTLFCILTFICAFSACCSFMLTSYLNILHMLDFSIQKKKEIPWCVWNETKKIFSIVISLSSSYVLDLL